MYNNFTKFKFPIRTSLDSKTLVSEFYKVIHVIAETKKIDLTSL